MSKNINARIALKRDTSANWTNYNPVLLDGELILVDTAEGQLRAKVGDGTKTYTQLPFTDEALRALIPLNLANGSAKGSLRSIYSSEKSDSYSVGEYAVALGRETKASSSAAHAEGDGTTASGVSAHAEGWSTTASGWAAHAEGYSTEASGYYSHAEGDYTTASGQSSHTEGEGTTASGQDAHAEGFRTTAAGEYQHVQGKYNVEDANNKYAHIVGNGTLNNARSNAHTIDWDGVGWFAGGLRIGGASQDDGAEVALLNDNGVIRKEHLPDGYPYSEFAEILPSETVEIDPDTGEGLIVTPFSLVVGGTYTVTWNGTEYSCVGQEFNLDGYTPCVAIGNVGALTGGDTTEEPFVIINVDAETAAGMGAYGAFITLDGSVTATVAISGTLVNKISAVYLPKMGASNIVDGKGFGSLRSVTSAEESDEYILGIGAVAEGVSTTASGYAAHAEGYETTASGEESHAEGEGTTASGSRSHAEGHATTASGDCSHTEGIGTTASGYVAHAEGFNTIASEIQSHAEGHATTASGNAAHAEGDNTIAASDYQHVQGKYNVEDADNKYAHIVGNGTGVYRRSNAHTIDWDGNAWYQGSIKVGGTGWDDATDEVVLNSNLATVATSGKYSDLSEKPIIPTKTSQLTNDSGFKTTDNNTTYSLSKSGSTITLTGSDGRSTFVTDSDTTYTLPAAGSSLGGVKTGGDVTISGGTITVNDDSHNHVISNIDGLQSALDGKLGTSLKGSANGLAELDSTGKILTSQLPSYVDDVIEGYYYNDKFYKESAHTTQIIGETGKIYIDLDTEKTYRWSGSTFAVISETLALGETLSTAYRGDRGKAAYDHSQIMAGNPHGTTKSHLGLGNVENKSSATIRGELTETDITNALGYTPPETDTTYDVATTSKDGLLSSSDKSKLDGIATGANNYSLPTASSSTLGGVKIGSHLSISNGVLSVPTASGTVAGATIVYPAASCTTFSSDSGTITPLAAQKAAKMFAITRPASTTNKAITRYSNTTGDVQDSDIIIEDVTNSRDNSAAQVIAIPASGGKKMVYGYCTDQVDGTSFIGGVFDASATSYPYNEGLAIGGTSGSLLWKGSKVLSAKDDNAISTIATTNLTASRALVSNSSGKIAVSAVTSTELGYLDGVTENIQTQLNEKQAEPGMYNTLPESGTELVDNAIYYDSGFQTIENYNFIPPHFLGVDNEFIPEGWAHGTFTTGSNPSVSFRGSFLGAAPTIEASKTYEFDVLDGVWVVQEVVSA